MTTLYWLVFSIWMRLTCQWLGLHRWGVTIGHGYARRFCERCWDFEIERLPEIKP